MGGSDQNSQEGAVGLLVFLVLLFGCLYLVPRVVQYVNKHWPQTWTHAAQNKIIHETQRQTQEDFLESQGGGFKGLISRSQSSSSARPTTPSHNHRRLTQLQHLQLAAKTSPIKIQPSNTINDQDRCVLETFFHSTHKTDSDWTSEVIGGNGRSNWLDREKGIERWQGITVCTHDTRNAVQNIGRVVKFQLHKNNINGRLDTLKPLTSMIKLSLWQNSIDGTLDGLCDMKMLVQLDLSKNALTGTLEPLSGLSKLEELNLGYNKLEGTLNSISTMSSLCRLVLCNNSFHGVLDGFEPIRTFQTIDLSQNPKLYGHLPSNLHRRWITGSLSVNTSGTGVGTDIDGTFLTAKEFKPTVQFAPLIIDDHNASGPATPASLKSSPQRSTSPITPIGQQSRSPSFKRVPPSPQQVQIMKQILQAHQSLQRGGTPSPLLPSSSSRSLPTSPTLRLKMPSSPQMQTSGYFFNDNEPQPSPLPRGSPISSNTSPRTVHTAPLVSSTTSDLSRPSAFTSSLSLSCPSSSSRPSSPSRFPPASPKAQEAAERIFKRASTMKASHLVVTDVENDGEYSEED